MIVLVLKAPFPRPIPLKNLHSFRQLPHQLKQRNQVSLFCLPQSDLLLSLRQKEHFHRTGQASNLHFAIQAALVTGDTVHDPGYVVKPVLHILEHLHHFSVSLIFE